MKKNFFISILALLLLSFVAIQCQKSGDITSESNTYLNNRQNEEGLLQQRVKNFLTENMEPSQDNQLQTLISDCYDEVNCLFENVHIGYDNLVMTGTCNSFTAVAKVSFCNGQIIIDQFSANFCSNYNQYLLTLNDYDLEQALDSFNYAASLIYEQRLIEAIGAPLCGSGTLLTSTFYNSLCYQWCVTVRSKPEDKYPLMEVSRVLCGDKCCKRSRNACVDTNGEVQFTNPTFQTIGNNPCQGYPLENCEGRLIGSCEHDCGFTSSVGS